MNAFPAFIPLWNVTVLIVGDGEAAEAKARLVAGSPARVVRVAADGALGAGVYDGARLVFIALDDAVDAAEAAAAARAAGALVNVVDRPELCDFNTPAIVDRSPVLCAIGTGGAAPVFATLLRGQIEARWPEGLGRLATLSGQIQAKVREAIPDLPARRAYWRRVLQGPAADAAYRGDDEEAERIALAELSGAGEPGRVWFLTAPARADLLTLAAVRALGAADRVVMGEGVADAVASYIRRDAHRVDIATPEQMAAWARAGEMVVAITTAPDDAGLSRVRSLGVEAGRLPVAG